MQMTFTGYHPTNELEERKILDHIANGGYEVVLYSNFATGGPSLLEARYVLLRQPGAPIDGKEGLHKVRIGPSDNERAGT